MTIRDSCEPGHTAPAPASSGSGSVLVLGLGLILLGRGADAGLARRSPAFFRGETLRRDTPTLIVQE